MNESMQCGWDNWLDDEDECLDMDLVEGIEAQHKLETSRQATNTILDGGRIVIMECNGNIPFDCSTSVGIGSVLGRGCLSALLHSRCVCPWLLQEDTEEESLLVFGAPCTPDMLWYNTDHFFNALKQSYNILEGLCQMTHQLNSSTSHQTSKSFLPGNNNNNNIFCPKQLRQETVTLYNCLWLFSHEQLCKDNTDNYTAGDTVTVARNLAAALLDILRFIGPLHQLQQHVTAAASPQGNACTSTAYHMFHLHLDIRWWTVSILHTLEATHGSLHLPVGDPCYQDLPLVQEPAALVSDTKTGALDQCLLFLVWDQLTLASRHVSSWSGCSPTSAAAGGCSCSAELAITVHQVLQHRHPTAQTECFWNVYRCRLLLLLSYKDADRTAGLAGPRSPPSVLLGVGSEVATMYPPSELRGLPVTTLFSLLLSTATSAAYDQQGQPRPANDPQIDAEPRLLVEFLLCLLCDRPVSARTTQLSSSGGSSSSGNAAAGSSSSASKIPRAIAEDSMRCVLRCVLSLTVLWQHEPRALDWCKLVWERWAARNIGSAFLLAGTAAVQALPSVSLKVSDWVSAAKERCTSPLDTSPQESSWRLFLRIISVVVRSGGVKAWKCMRGLVLSRFTKKKLAELCPSGVYNIATLLLTLAHCFNMTETASLASELLCECMDTSDSNCVGSSSNGRKLCMVVRAVMSFVHMLTSNSCHVSVIVTRLSSFVAPLAHHYTNSRDIALKREAGRVLCLYLSCGAEVCSLAPDLSLGHHSLQPLWLRNVLPSCDVSELQQLLHSLHTVLQSVLLNAIKHSTTQGGAEVVAGIERCVGSFLRQHSSSLTPPPQLAAAAASLTLCHALLAGTVTTLPLDDAGATASTTNSNVNESGMSLPSKNNAYNNNNTNFNGIDATKSIGSDKASSREAKVNHKECASSLFTYLLTTQRIRDEFTLAYISGLVSLPLESSARTSGNTKTAAILLSGDEGENCYGITTTIIAPYQEERIFSRFTCCILETGDTTQVLSLVPGVFALKLVRGYLPSPPACPFTALLALVRNMAREHQAATSLQSRHMIQSCCLSLMSGVDKVLATVLQRTPPLQHLDQLLHCLAGLVQHAPALLYLKSKGPNSVLPVIVSCVLKCVKVDKALPQHLSRPLALALPKILQGICALPLEQDPFLSRNVRNLFSSFMHRYPADATHPFLAALTSPSEGGANTTRLRTLFLEVLKNDTLSLKAGQDTAKRNTSLQVLLRTLVSTPKKSEWCDSVTSCLLPSLLELLLTADDRQTNRNITDLLRHLLADQHRSVVAPLVCQFVRCQVSWQSAKVFLVLRGLSELQPALVEHCLPQVEASIHETEAKRGTGHDGKLRQMYQELLAAVRGSNAAVGGGEG